MLKTFCKIFSLLFGNDKTMLYLCIINLTNKKMENTIKEMVRFQLTELGWMPVESESLGRTVMINQPKCLLPRLLPTCVEFMANAITDGDCTIFSLSANTLMQMDKDGNFLY